MPQTIQNRTQDIEIVQLSTSNIDEEHICCALGGTKHQAGVDKKKEFLTNGFEKGLQFHKLDVRGKVFVEFVPAESSWKPVQAPGFLVIHCLWVSGSSYKNRGHGKELLQLCIAQGEGQYKGVVVVTGKAPYLTDTSFFLKNGFEVVESLPSGYDLVCLKFDKNTDNPVFSPSVYIDVDKSQSEVHFEYTHQCPFVPKCLADMSLVAKEFGLTVSIKELKTAQQAQNSLSPFGTFGVFLHGKFLTHQMMSQNKFRRVLEARLAK